VPGAAENTLDQLALQLARTCETEIRESEEKLLEQHKTIAALVAAETRR
jgi:hypothetical protein